MHNKCDQETGFGTKLGFAQKCDLSTILRFGHKIGTLAVKTLDQILSAVHKCDAKLARELCHQPFSIQLISKKAIDLLCELDELTK